MKIVLIPSRSRGSNGFTIIELLIASGVFATLLLLSLSGFLQIGRLFYKGVSATQTQQVARQVMDTIQADINFSQNSSVVVAADSSFTASVNGVNRTFTRYYFCANKHRYTFIQGKVVNSAAEATMMSTPQAGWHDFGLLRDRMPGNSCAPPFTGAFTALNNPVELLSDNMRISNFTVAQVGGDPLYNVNLKIAYGNDAILQNPTLTTATCDSSLSSSQYCFITNLLTTVRVGI